MTRVQNEIPKTLTKFSARFGSHLLVDGYPFKLIPKLSIKFVGYNPVAFEAPSCLGLFLSLLEPEAQAIVSNLVGTTSNVGAKRSAALDH